MEGILRGTCVVCCMLWLASSVEACNPYEFKCDNFDCIGYKYRCDGMNTCADGSDEKNCPPEPVITTTPARPPHYRPCFDGMFECSNGRCIYKDWHCDGQNDCGDFSDETRCGGPEEEHKGNGTLLNTESIIGITIALTALALLIGGVLAYMVHYRRKMLHGSRGSRNTQTSDIIEPIAGLPFNFPREALLRVPPPRYSSQDELNASHINPGYNHDEEILRPPPCYSSNPDLSGGISMTESSIEPPPSYASHQDLSVIETSLSEFSQNQGQNNCHASYAMPVNTQHGSENTLNGTDNSKSDITQKAGDTVCDKDKADEWRGSQWTDLPKAVRKQYRVSTSDTMLSQGVVLQPNKVHMPAESSTLPDLAGGRGESMRDSEIMTISAFVDHSSRPDILVNSQTNVSYYTPQNIVTTPQQSSLSPNVHRLALEIGSDTSASCPHDEEPQQTVRGPLSPETCSGGTRTTASKDTGSSRSADCVQIVKPVNTQRYSDICTLLQDKYSTDLVPETSHSHHLSKMYSRSLPVLHLSGQESAIRTDGREFHC